MTVIRLIYANMTERLLESLAEDLRERREAGANPLDPVELVVPNRNMETWVRLGIAQACGIAANLRFWRLERFISEVVSKACPGEAKLADLDTVEAAVLAALLDEKILSLPGLEPVARYLDSSSPSSLFSREEAQASEAPASGVNNSYGKGQTYGAENQGPGYPADKHLAADGADLRRVQLAARIAYLFQEYIYSRPEMITAWRKRENLFNFSPDETLKPGIAGPPFSGSGAAETFFARTERWQSHLWQAVFGVEGILARNGPPEGGRWISADLIALDPDLLEMIRSRGLPPVHIFGISYMARLFQLLFARLGEFATLNIYTLNPCAEFWEDVETDREFFYRLDREISRREKLFNLNTPAGIEDPFGLFEADNPALRYWGRPGREHIRLLGELTDCDFQGAFADPAAAGESSLLQLLQKDILLRRPERKAGGDSPETKEDNEPAGCLPRDESIRLVAAPSVRREIEWVADEIWKLIGNDHPKDGRLPLRFSDIAIIVNSAGRDSYPPQIESVFAACHDLPVSISDLPGAASSPLIEAMNMLLQLPFGRFSRAEMLALMSHPAVIGPFEDLTPAAMAARADALGIVFGADHADHRETYINEDVLNWDQGIRRLALGVFMTGERSGDRRIFQAGGRRWLVEEVGGQGLRAAGRFGLLARSLIADARFVRNQTMTLSQWGRFYAAQADTYLRPADEADSLDRLRLLRALGRLEAMDPGLAVSGKIASELAGRVIGSLEGGRGQYLAEGVVVSSFLPMRAIPFRVVFLLGLGEGLFPASGQRDALDLRAARRCAGDVDPAERDRYMFLETLLCTREKLYLSYVRRDGQTGDPLQPSAVVQELLHILKTGYPGRGEKERIIVEPPLRRYDQAAVKETTFFDEALAEARIQELTGERSERSGRMGMDDRDNHSLHASATINSIDTLIHSARPEAREKLSEMLLLPGKPPAPTALKTTARKNGPAGGTAAEEEFPLSFSRLRRFLECPMQGWASAMLDLPETGEDPAEQEEEDFAINRLIETELLRDVFSDAAAGGLDPGAIYRERALRLHLAGKIPVGELGRLLSRQHLEILEDWRICLRELLQNSSGDLPGPDNLLKLHRVRLGRAHHHRPADTILDPLILEVRRSGNETGEHTVPVRLFGLTENLTPDRLTSIILQPQKAPAARDRTARGRNFRYLLRGLLDHVVLSAAGAAGNEERRILIFYAGGKGEKDIVKMRLRPMGREPARAFLTTLTGDLLEGHHAYLLPCEAVFLEYLDRSGFAGAKTGKGKGRAAADEGPAGLAPPHGESLAALAAEMAANERASFSSLWGPVPSPRSYDPPPADLCARIAARRFGPILESISALEGL